MIHRLLLTATALVLALAPAPPVSACDLDPAKEAQIADILIDLVQGQITLEQAQALIDALVGPGCYTVPAPETE